MHRLVLPVKIYLLISLAYRPQLDQALWQHSIHIMNMNEHRHADIVITFTFFLLDISYKYHMKFNHLQPTLGTPPPSLNRVSVFLTNFPSAPTLILVLKTLSFICL